MIRYDKKEKRALGAYILVFILLAAVVAISGYISYRNFKNQYRTQVERQLSSVAKLKANELVKWRYERMGDAEMLHLNTSFSVLTQTYLENPDNSAARTQL